MSVDDDVVKGGEGGGGGGGESHRPSSAETVQVVVVGAAAASPAVADDGAPAAEQTMKQNQPEPSLRRQDGAASCDDGGLGKEVAAAVARLAVMKSEATDDGVGKEAVAAVVKSEAARDDGPPGNEAVAAVKSEAARGETAAKAAESRTVRLLGEPLTSHGPYEFYGALAYRDDQEDAALKKKTRWKERSPATAEGARGEHGEGGEEEEEEDDDGWSVVRMNHFYAVRPWYSKRHSCAADRKQMRLQQQLQQARRRDRSPGSRAAAKERREHRHQQSVCIGELELLWRDDTVRPAAKRRGDGGGEAKTAAAAAASSEDETTKAAAAGPPTADDSSVPRRRMLPRRTRQPSAKKIEAAESLAVAAAAAAAENHPMHQTHRRKLQQQLLQSAGGFARHALPAAPWGDYVHGNLLCSVRLYVMPDQTAAGRLSGVHGDDEVLEINTWGANGAGGGVGAEGGNAFVNGGVGGGGGTAYNGGGATGEDYGGGAGDSGASPSSCAATGCSGLVLRVEDFVEWVRGGLMNDDDDEEWSSASDGESRPEEAAVKREYDQKAPLVRAKEERQEAAATASVDVGGRRRSAVDEAVSAESVPLAAAKIVEKADAFRRGGSRVDRETTAAVNGGADEPTKADDDRCQDVELRVASMKTPTTEQKTKKMKTGDHHQRLVVMSYSRYCRYRAQLQRGQEERLYDSGGKESSLAADRTNAVRVLFCRDTYDYPAELLLQPFNSPQHGQQQNSPVLVNHMAPKLKGWPAHPASWMSFRWNRVRRRLRHMERGNASNDEQRRRRRRKKLKKKCHRRQNGNNATGVSVNYLSSSDDGDSDDTDTDGSSASNDGNTNTTTSDSDGAPPTLAVTAKATSKNLTSKENGSGHYNKKPLAGPTVGNTFVINGTTVSTIAVNKRPAVVSEQSGQQQSTKRRRFVYPVAANQPVLQRGTYQQLVFHPRHQQPQKQLYQQFNHLTQLQRQHLIVAQQQHQQRQSLNKRLPVPVSSLQPSTTRLIHHHLPPSVSIVPVVVSGAKNVTILQQQQQQQRFNNKLQIRPKPHANVSITQRPNISSGRQQMSLSPSVMGEYNKNRKLGTNDNSCHKSTTMAAAIAACQKRARYVDIEGEQPQQREDDERQRRWLVDALRLGGLEVTAVPFKGNPVSPNKSGSESSKVLRPVETSVQPKREKSHSNIEHPNGSVPVQNEQRPDCSHDDSNQDSDTDSVVMTVTPDVICLLNKSQQHQQSQLHALPVSSSTPSMPALKQLRPSVTVETVSSSSQNAGTEPALHDKITRAIDALKKQQKQSLNASNSSLTMNASSLLQDNSVSDSKLLEPRQRKLGLAGPPPRLIKTKEGYLLQSNVRLPGKPINIYPSVAAASGIGPPRLLSAIKISTQQQQLLQQQQKLKSPAKNFEISILPATTSTATNATQFQLQQQQKVCVSAETRSAPVGSSKASFSMAVKQQLQRRIATGSSTAPALPSVADNRIMSVMGSEPTLQQLMQHQIIVMGTNPAAHASQTKQIIIDKINLQPKKKD